MAVTNAGAADVGFGRIVITADLIREGEDPAGHAIGALAAAEVEPAVVRAAAAGLTIERG
jgi:hypothetical protein